MGSTRTMSRQPGQKRGAVVAFMLLAAGRAAGETREDALVAEFLGSYPVEASPTGTVREFELVARETETVLVDRIRTRVWAYNDRVPGPTLRIRLGETLRVRFTNRLPQATTIHWHGVRVPNGMDGVPHATQPPIEPGGSFVYEFTPKDAGTFWFHPHVRSSEQVERGLYGVLIVEDAVPPAYSRDVAWMIDDWLLDREGQVYPHFNTPHDLSHDGRWGNVITVNGRTDTVLEAHVGERIRLRLLNASNGRVYVPQLPGLDARVIAVDGLYLREPIAAGQLELAPGNRMDLDVVVREVEGRSVPLVDGFMARRPNELARIRILPGVGPTPDFPSPARAHVPAWKDGSKVPVGKEFRLAGRQGGPLGIEWTINGTAFAGHDHGGDSARLDRGKFTRLRFVNDSYRLHPMHLHGMFFKVLARDGHAVDEPFFRDTMLIYPQEAVDVGLVPLDAGRWMMHCHILEHAEAGMMTMLAVGD